MGSAYHITLLITISKPFGPHFFSPAAVLFAGLVGVFYAEIRILGVIALQYLSVGRRSSLPDLMEL